MDQRGTGGSQPFQRSCGSDGQLPLIENGTEDEYLERAQLIAANCKKTVPEYSSYLRSIGTVQSATDFEYLRQHIGAQKVRLFGISYGTHIGLSYMKSYRSSVDRAILALTEGPNHTFKLPLQFDEAVKRIDLSRQRENKKPVFQLLKKALSDFEGGRQITATALDRTSSSFGVSQFELKLFIRGFFGSARQVDRLYYQISNEDYHRLHKYVTGLRSLQKFRLKYYVTDCRSYASRDRLALIDEQSKKSILGRALNFPFPNVCSMLDVQPLPDKFRLPVKSDVPALLLSGDKDYKTPTENAVEISKGLSNYTHVVEKGSFHRVCTKDECLNLVRQFMEQGAQNQSSNTIFID